MARFLLKVLVIGLLVFLAAVGWVIYDGMNDSHGPASCAVVLAKAPQTGAEADPVLQAQLDRVIELYREKVVPQVIVSGADASQGGDGEKVLSTMTQYLLAHGLPASAVLSDSKGTSLDASAGDVAAYLQQSGNPNVMIVVPYYEILRTKLALWRAGVGQVLQVHVGRPGVPDAVPAARAMGDAGARVFEDDLKPAFFKLIARAQGEGQELSDKIKNASGAAQPVPAPVNNPATAPPSAATDAPAVAASAASSPVTPPPAPLPDGQEVNATGVATFDVPRSWSERIVPPILDPVWAAPDSPGSMPPNLVIGMRDAPGPLSSIADDVERTRQGAGFSGMSPVSNDAFSTAWGLQGIRIVMTAMVLGKSTEFVIYVFPANGDKKVFMAADCLASDAAATVPIFDACARTVRPW